MTQEIEITDTLELRTTDGNRYFDIPEWYLELTGTVSVMTPYSTTISYRKEKHSIRPFTREYQMLARHYIFPHRMTYNEVKHSELDPDLIRFKEWEGEERYYRIKVVQE